MLSVFIFRRSYRLKDNIGLNNALEKSKTVIPIFIFTPEQIINNSYKSDNAIQFMIESLNDLNEQLKNNKSKLYYFFGEQHKIIEKIIKKLNINSVFVNQDYTKYSVERDLKIKKTCEKYNVNFESYEDILLNDVKSILTGKSVYKKFTPYFNKASKIIIKKPKTVNGNYYNKKIDFEFNKSLINYNHNKNIQIKGGRKEGLKILKKIIEFKNYNEKRNDLTYQTTLLSAYIKFGCLSIREIYYEIINNLGKKNNLIKQLYWRDFYYNIAYEYPNVFKGPLKLKYSKIKWNNNIKYFNAWKNGKTGFPIVDAGMRQLNITGYMHNRARLITSNFLIKILLIDWRKGEKYYATKLIDYDPSVNNGNWQWSSSSGADSQPYFRIFNPWLQSEKYDKNCEYIKKWIPELKNVENNKIHKWYKFYNNEYIKPIVDYKKQKIKSIKMYKKLF